MVFSIVPSVFAALIAAVVMVLGGCLDMNQAYRSISWQSVVLIAAMIPMSIALQVTGGAELIANGLVNSLGSIGPLALMVGVFLLTTAFSQVINNTATAVLISPIVLQAALVSGVSPYPLLMTVAISASTAFLTPIGTTTNLMVMTPGGYNFNDYIIVNILRHAVFVDEYLRGHPPKFEDFNLLPIQFQNLMFGVWQADKWQRFVSEVLSEFFRIFGTHHDNGRFPFHKLFIILTQLRHMRLAKRSHKPPIKYKQHILLSFKI
jgi:hypothetical protein